MIDAPCTSGIRKPAENSNVWCSGRTLSSLSCLYSENSDDSLLTIDVKFLCVSITPFGVPVVPLVKISDASVSPFESGWTAPTETSGSVSSSSNASTCGAVSPLRAR